MRFYKLIFITLLITFIVAIASFTSVNAASCSLKANTNATNVNIRSGAGTSNSVITTAKSKTDVTLINTSLYNKEWYKIKLSSGKIGYVHKDYLTIKKNQLFIPKTKTYYAGYSFSYNVINTTGKKVKWSSSDRTVAKANSKGLISCLKKGTVTYTAKAGTVTAKSTLKVINADVVLADTPKELFLDESLTLKATCKKSVTFSSSDKKIATISSKGVITPVSAGSVTFTAKSKSGSDSCTIKFKKREITLKAEKTTLYTGNRGIIIPSGGLNPYTFKSSNTKVLTVTNDGIIKAVGAGTAKITCKSGNLSKSKTFTVKSGNYIDISHTDKTVRKGMTLYLKSNTSGVKWKSSDTSVAKVENGYVLGVGVGRAIISVTTDKGISDCLVTVEEPEVVRFVYTSENSALPGDSVTFYAITDTLRTGVKFKVTAPDNTSFWLTSPKKTTEDGRYIWSKSKVLETKGLYKITAYSKKSGGSWETEASGEATTYVGSGTSKNAVAFGERRASTDAINIISQHEGFIGTVYTDTMANVPTVGYGRVVYAGSTFYNGMTKKEAFAFLVKTINDSGFTSRLNTLLTDNKIKFSQQHFDALIDFSYNLGAYAITNDDVLYNTLLNTYGKSGNNLKGYVNTLKANVTGAATVSAKTIATLAGGTEVNLVDTKIYNSKWFKVKLSDGTVGFILTSNITKRTTDTTVRNLNNVNYKTFAKNYLPYHHAGGSCYMGLLYRRVDEVETFFFGDYVRDGKSNKYSLSYTCSKNSSTHL